MCNLEIGSDLRYCPKLSKEQIKEKIKGLSIGTREWVRKNGEINLYSGCLNGCVYCYARFLAHRTNKIHFNDWVTLRENRKIKIPKKIKSEINKHDFMLPTSSEIFPNSEQYGNVFDNYCQKFEEILTKGYTVLITSKPRKDIIEPLIDKFEEYKAQITFRFTIGSMDNKILKILEPNAPKYEERLHCLKYAHKKDFNTSISIEPLIDANPKPLIDAFNPYLSPLEYGKDSGVIWVGLLRQRYTPIWFRNLHNLNEIYATIKANQSFNNVFKWYQYYYDNNRIQFKETVKALMLKNSVKMKA